MGNVVERVSNFIASQGGRRRSDDEAGNSHTYTYPTKSGSPFFSAHFIMGGERFETYQPEAFLFGENLDLNFLGSRPTPFPYAAPLAHEPTRAIRSLLNIRKESVRFIRVTDPDLIPKSEMTDARPVVIGKDDECKKKPVEKSEVSSQKDHNSHTGSQHSGDKEKEKYHYNIEFVFDSDVACSIAIYYFCHEEMTSTGVTFTPKDSSVCSDKVTFPAGAGQIFSQSRHVFTPSNYSDCDLMYSAFDENGFFDPKIPFPVAIQMSALEGSQPRQSHALIAIIERNNNGSYSLKPFVQKLFIDGLAYLMQEIYGIENKTTSSNEGQANKFMSAEEEDECNSASECVVCLSDPRDTLILPCRHLCLCYACADSLRYQANNCPICRAPFRALLQIRAVRNRSDVLSSPQAVDPNSPIPAGFAELPLIEALNGPFQFYRDHGPPDIDRTPVSVRRSHRRHKHAHAHHQLYHHQHQHADQIRSQPHLNQEMTRQESIPLPSRRMVPNSGALVTNTTAATSNLLSSSEKVPPEPAPMDWKLAGSRIRRKQSDEETSSSASSGFAPHETTRLLTDSIEPVEFLQRSASTRSRSSPAAAISSPKLKLRDIHHSLSANYAVIHAADDFMMTSETASSSSSASAHFGTGNSAASFSGRNVTGSDDEEEEDENCKDFSNVLREIQVNDLNAGAFDLSSLRLAESGANIDLETSGARDEPV